MQNKKRICAALALHVLIVLLVIVAWVMMATATAEEGMLEGSGLTNLRFYTVQSNLLAGLASLVYALALIPVLRGKTERVAPWVQTLALVGAGAIALTFLTVVCFLTPLYGALNMYRSANFFFHLLIPLLCMAGYVLLDCFGQSVRFAALLGAVPMLLYGTGYTVNCLTNGVGEWPNTNDWYGFLNWGIPIGLVIFAVLALATVGVTALLRRGNRAVCARLAAQVGAR